MGRYLKVILIITLSFVLVTLGLWYGSQSLLRSEVRKALVRAGDKLDCDVSIAAIEFDTQGILSLDDLRFEERERNKTPLASIGSIRCVFDPLHLLSEGHVTPRCLISDVLLKADADSISKHLRSFRQRLSDTGESSASSAKGALSTLRKYLASPLDWSLAFLNVGVKSKHPLLKSLEAGQFHYTPGIGKEPGEVFCRGLLHNDRSKAPTPFLAHATFMREKMLPDTLSLRFPKRLEIPIAIGAKEGLVSLRSLSAAQGRLRIRDVKLATEEASISLQSVVIGEREDLIRLLQTETMNSLPALPALLEGKELLVTTPKGRVSLGEFALKTSKDKRGLFSGKSLQIRSSTGLLRAEAKDLDLSFVSLAEVLKGREQATLTLIGPKVEAEVVTSPLLEGEERTMTELLSALLSQYKSSAPTDTTLGAKGLGKRSASLLSGMLRFWPKTVLRNGTLELREHKSEQIALALKGVNGFWHPTAAIADFGISALLPENEAEAAATVTGQYLFSESRIVQVHLKTANTLFPKLLADLSDKFIAGPNAEAHIDLRLDMSTQARWNLEGTIVADGLGFDWWRVAPTPVEDLAFTTSITAAYDLIDQRLSVTLPDLKVGRAKVDAQLVVKQVNSVPIIGFRLQAPKQPCRHIFGAIPPAMIPRLKGLRVAGDIEYKLKLDLDTADPYSLKLDIKSDLESCTVLSLGKKIDMGMLRDPQFIHRPFVEGEDLDVAVGPGTLDWMPYYMIPNYVSMAAVATEDLDFFEHTGFKVSLIRRAMKLNLDKERYVYGGSTISQQLVKNLFLSREKNLSRKLEEAILTWQMEREVSKVRILELYLNCIEYGPGVYGITQGARHYFGKRVNALTPLEGAFLMGLKPCPSCGERQWKRKGVNKRWQSKLEFIMNRLFKRGWIREEELKAEAPYLPTFYYEGEGRVFNTNPRR